MASIVDKILGGVAGPVVTYLTRRAELSQARFEAKLKLEQAAGDRKADLIKAGLAADASWESIFAEQAASSWKDEYVLLVVSIPAVMAFIPYMAPYVEKGFGALSQTPTWYQLILISVFLATFGIRYWRRSQSDT